MTKFVSFGTELAAFLKTHSDHEMQLTMTGEYALRAMLYICSSPGDKKFKIAEIASQNDIPENFLRKIVVQLKDAGYLTGHKGNGGGILLNVDPEKITPLHIIEAVEGEIGLNKCLLYKDFCTRDNYCSIHVIWAEAQKQLKEQLSSKNMLELARQNTERHNRWQK